MLCGMPRKEPSKAQIEAQALLDAAKVGTLSDLQRLVSLHGMGIDPRNRNGWTPLMLSSRYGHVECVQFLLRHGADIDVLNRNNKSAAYFACRLGHAKVLACLLDRDPVHVTATLAQSTRLGDTALIAAATHGHFDCVRLMLERLSPTRQLELLLTPPADVYNEHIPMRLRAGPRASVVQLAFDHGHVEIANYLVEVERSLTREGLDSVLSSSLSSYAAADPPSSSSSSTPASSSSSLSASTSKSALHSALHHSHHRSSSAPVRTLYSFPHYSSFPTDLTDLVLDFVVPPSHVHKRRKSSSYLLDFDQDDPVSHIAGGGGSVAGHGMSASSSHLPPIAGAAGTGTGGGAPTLFAGAPGAGAGTGADVGALPTMASSTASGAGAGLLRSRKRRSVDVLWPVPEDLAISAPPTPMASTTVTLAAGEHASFDTAVAAVANQQFAAAMPALPAQAPFLGLPQ